MFVFALPILIGSVLLFLIEPMIARYILPWFGGGPSIWSTCMLFFQVSLLAGYAYAHYLGTRLTPRRQAIVHLAALGLSILFLPITPGDSWKPQSPIRPELQIMLLLLVTIGVPFGLLSAASPLHQYWFNRSLPHRSPYRLYSLSNIGSVLGLLLYPFVLEPLLTLRAQTLLWSAAYGIFILASGWCALRMVRQPQAAESPAAAPGHEKVSIGRWNPIMWVLLAACGSVMLLATTNQMCQEVAVFPFLWIVPLTLYLLSFIICFDNERWYNRYVWGTLLAGCLGGVVWLLNARGTIHMPVQVGALSTVLFACCMVCHGELVRSKPPGARLTSFYLMVALGGAVGGVFVNFAAPHIFSGFWEFHIGLFLTLLLFGVSVMHGQALRKASWPQWVFRVAWMGCLVALGIVFQRDIRKHDEDAIARARNFYGVLRVVETGADSEDAMRTLYHGPIEHGNEFLDDERRDWPTTYYGPESGLNLACETLSRWRKEMAGGDPPAGLSIGVVGLGAGTSACMAGPGDRIRFYEINPEINRIARNYFYYLADCRGDWRVVMGDARISMERELAANAGGNRFDVLAVDAFNGDAIPVHLITKEAFELYWHHLRDDGILAVHISNLHLDLAPVVLGLAQEMDKKVLLVSNSEDEERGIDSSDWALVTSNERFLNDPEVQKRNDTDRDTTRTIVWTDQYSNIMRLLHWD